MATVTKSVSRRRNSTLPRMATASGRSFNFRPRCRRRRDTDLATAVPGQRRCSHRHPAAGLDSPWRSNRLRCLSRQPPRPTSAFCTWMASIRRPSRRTQPISIRLFRRRLPPHPVCPECPVRLPKDAYLVLTRKGAADSAVGILDYLVTGELTGPN